MTKLAAARAWWGQFPLCRALFSLPFLLLLTTPTFAQHENHPAIMAVDIDGAKNPELISDQLAYRHLILALALPRNAPSNEIVRNDAQFAQIGLQAEDLTRLQTGLAGVREEVDGLEQSEQIAAQASISSGNDENVLKIRNQKDVFLDATGERLKSSLTAVGQAVLDNFIQEHVKRRIVVYETRQYDTADQIAPTGNKDPYNAFAGNSYDTDGTHRLGTDDDEI